MRLNPGSKRADITRYWQLLDIARLSGCRRMLRYMTYDIALVQK